MFSLLLLSVKYYSIQVIYINSLLEFFDPIKIQVNGLVSNVIGPMPKVIDYMSKDFGPSS
jgi:hypothetical protein